ncbi:MAG: cytidyltransferase [Candidatus Marinimicrobia bacterium]|nr:cytidyltransferase [Candidatus Neomarinimicrobiota bacterium]|tara:strand:- start:9386 stop:9820 length:435 start_codon:yes stop_codon:yes gene_type:complete
MNKKIIILSGGFDPVHKGHVRMFKAASEYGDVVVGANSDDWLIRKKGKFFMPFLERKEILESIQYIDSVLAFDDSDDSACQLIKDVKSHYGHDVELYFGNGGDRTNETTPEIEYCEKNNIGLIWDLGGGKIQSSSDLLNNYEND